MLKTLHNRPETVLALVLLWKAALLVFTAQPVPANDSFFYDGPVVNLLMHGRYCNPAIANALPISGNEIFSAYPPLYQLTLLGWMSVCGTSALAAMWLHFVLFAVYAVLVLATLRELRVPVWAAHFAGLFLLGITFHDRPDSLAHVFGMAAVFALVRSFRPRSSFSPSSSNESSRTRTKCEDDVRGRGLATLWLWLAATSVILCLGTSLQIGGVYFLLIWLALLLAARLCTARTPWSAPAVMTLVPVALLLGVKQLWPHLWAGFQEHAQQTPSLTSWRLPDAMELLKIGRSVPGLLLVLVVVPFSVLPAFHRRIWHGSADATPTAHSGGAQRILDARSLAILLAASVAAIAVLVAASFFLTANLVLIAAYLQPLVVGALLTVWAGAEKSAFRLAWTNAVLALAVCLASIRAIGLTTIGVACAVDASEREVQTRVASELSLLRPGEVAALSAAYLYDAWPENGRLKLLHADWLGPAVRDNSNAEVDALRAVKPKRLILTQFDYHRRYVRVLAQLQSMSSGVSVRVENLARVRPPDASPRWQRVVQHVSWAPVIVKVEWGE